MQPFHTSSFHTPKEDDSISGVTKLESWGIGLILWKLRKFIANHLNMCDSQKHRNIDGQKAYVIRTYGYG